MKKEIKTSIQINANPEKVWAILTDFNEYPNWNPFIRSIKGEVEPGRKIKVHLTPPDALSMVISPRVVSFKKNKELRWLGHLLLPGLFDGEHRFELVQNEDGTTTFVQSEQFKGILVSMFKALIDINTLNGFKLMNQKLKEQAEKNY
ncbi:MAG: SRPBCC domain-containing protein [Bacteroidales bacterium]|nr:SRPBCC domain-containing protein [Bacteroidales bacterium]